KGLEVIEAHYLYGVGYDSIDVVVHPQSIIHSLVEFKDKSVIAQLGNPSMKLPIQYALSYPKRLNLEMKKLNLAEIKNLTFEEPDLERFSCLKYAYEAGKISGSMPCVMNAANEIAVPAFLDGKIGFLDIPKIIRKTMDNHNTIKKPDINRILDADKKTRGETQKIIGTEDF
ncbi:1-deoxy-D-xylulose-5-phosphate reductoisomerase, partial [Candidatus Woesearchaeota archaeon]|nr:1-deoxy-D-xylulose-5-phosphate reductoisomerase [Candidatus Woesearchaeota archaeon]